MLFARATHTQAERFTERSSARCPVPFVSWHHPFLPEEARGGKGSRSHFIFLDTLAPKWGKQGTYPCYPGTNLHVFNIQDFAIFAFARITIGRERSGRGNYATFAPFYRLSQNPLRNPTISPSGAAGWRTPQGSSPAYRVKGSDQREAGFGLPAR
jgi:hypothetical protein